jgi:hypothetical protein
MAVVISTTIFYCCCIGSDGPGTVIHKIAGAKLQWLQPAARLRVRRACIHSSGVGRPASHGTVVGHGRGRPSVLGWLDGVQYSSAT